MNKISRAVTFLLLLCVYPAHASNIVKISVGHSDIPFLLDDKGQVWAFRKPVTLEGPIKLPNLNHIIKIEPYIALDTNGHVFTWNLNEAESQWSELGVEQAKYTVPKQVEGLQGVTAIASSSDHFVAVINNMEIVDWVDDKKKYDWDLTKNGAIRRVISRKGVTRVVAYSSPAMISIKKEIIHPASLSLVALFDDGMVMGWGVKPKGGATNNADWEGVQLTQSPGATDIAINPMHTVILTSNGVPLFWGGCDGFDNRGVRYEWHLLKL